MRLTQSAPKTAASSASEISGWRPSRAIYIPTLYHPYYRAWYNDMDVTESFEAVKIAADADEYFDAVSFGNYYIFVAR